MNYSIPSHFSNEEKLRLSKKYNKNLNKLLENKIQISFGKSILDLCSLDSLRIVYDEHSQDKTHQIFKKILIKNFIDSESNCPGSGLISTLAFLEAINSNLDLNETLKDLSSISLKSRRGNQKELKSFLKSMCLVEEFNLLEKLIEEGGFLASCKIKSTNEIADYYRIEKNYKFKVKLNNDFSISTNKQSIEKNKPYIIVGDGVIESVSDIHHILEYFSSNKRQCFLICRGFSKDVISTLSVNHLRGNLNVFPLELIVDIESINSLKDICVISGSELISNLKGDTFSQIDIDDLARVDRVEVSLNEMSISNSSRSKNVVSHIEKLRVSLDEESVEDKINLLEKRISSLIPRRFSIYLSNYYKDSYGLRKDRIKCLIALINNYCITGKIDLDFETENKVLHSIRQKLFKSNIKDFPANAFFVGIKSGISNAELLKNSSSIILLD